MFASPSVPSIYAAIRACTSVGAPGCLLIVKVRAPITHSWPASQPACLHALWCICPHPNARILGRTRACLTSAALVVLGWVVLLLCQLLLRQSHHKRVIVILRSRWHKHGCAATSITTVTPTPVAAAAAKTATIPTPLTRTLTSAAPTAELHRRQTELWPGRGESACRRSQR
jgi:hypothetical protein